MKVKVLSVISITYSSLDPCDPDITHCCGSNGLIQTVNADCPGYKLLLQNSWPWQNWQRCCNAVKNDKECGCTFYLSVFSGMCYCIKSGFVCPSYPAVVGGSTKYEFGGQCLLMYFTAPLSKR